MTPWERPASTPTQAVAALSAGLTTLAEQLFQLDASPELALAREPDRLEGRSGAVAALRPRWAAEDHVGRSGRMLAAGQAFAVPSSYGRAPALAAGG